MIISIMITGVPGVGKSEIAKAIGTQFNQKIINDKIFCEKNNLGTHNSIKEYVVDIKKLNAYLKNGFKYNAIYEGHLWCELSKNNLHKFNKIIILKTSKKIIENRLKQRKYSEVKIFDNIFCQDTKYFEKTLTDKNISFKIINIHNNLKENTKKILEQLKWQKH